MKLYYSPGACSLAPHIILQETGLPFTIEPVNTKTKHYKGGDFNQVNPKGYVPVLELDNGEVLTEGVVIMQYISDLKPDTQLVPKAGSMERYREQEWLNFISTEIHKGFSPLWAPTTPEEYKKIATERLKTRFDYLEETLKDKQFLMGSRFTAADAYLFTVLNWSNFLKIDMTKWTGLMGYMERVKARPAVQAALKAEGLLK